MTTPPLAYALVAAAFAFAFSMGAHYTGACMGMPRATGAIRANQALWIMAPLTLVGAIFASGAVETTVGHGILGGATVPIVVALALVLSAFLLTTLFNLARIPTSTIQILVFSAVGVGLASGRPVSWGLVGTLAVLWAVAPLAAFALGFTVVSVWDRWAPASPRTDRLASHAAAGLVAVGAVASFAMGANDVANASGAFVMTGLFGLELAGLVGGLGLAAGVLTWGKPLLERVAFDIVRLDVRTAASAQLAQSAVVLGYVATGYFTSLNQALIGAMLGVGFARKRLGEGRLVERTVRGILLGWGAGPASGAVLGAAVYALLRAAGL